MILDKKRAALGLQGGAERFHPGECRGNPHGEHVSPLLDFLSRTRSSRADSCLITCGSRLTLSGPRSPWRLFFLMKLFKLHRFFITGLLAILGFSLMGAAISHGQIPGLTGTIDGTNPAKPLEPETEEQTLARYEQWRQEAKATLTRLEASALPSLITEGQSDLRRRNLEQLTLLLSRATKNVAAAKDARKVFEDSKAAAKAWTGFSEPPPYSLFMVDELLNEQYLTKTALKSAQASLANFERLLASTMGEVKAAEGQVNSGINAVKEAVQDSDSAKWQLDSALEALRLLGVRATVAEGNGAIQKDRITALGMDLELMERKLTRANANSRLIDSDLAQVKKLSDERRVGFEKEFVANSKRLKVAIANRDKAQNEIAEISSKAIEPAPAPEQLELAKFRLRVTEDRVDALQSVSESYEGLVQLENLLVKLYSNRSLAIQAKTPSERAGRIQVISQIQDRLQAWISVLRGEIADTSAELSNLESRASSIGSEDATFALINEQRAAKSEKLTMLQRLSKAAGAQRRLVTRWLDEYAPANQPKGLMARVENIGFKVWEGLKKIWSFELMTFENKAEIDGRTVISKAPVTLGMLLGALLFFALGYFVISRIASRIQLVLVSRKHVAQAQAKTLRNWLMLVVGFFLLLGSFSLLNIPLTAFAFFGGALAIGFGFGMQTLIKNFISGIILLFERKIRVGDLLEVDGFIGRVVEINTRSSIIRNADDMETLVPNSLFLENRVTNWTLSSSKVRRTLRVGVAYGTAPQKVMEVLIEAASRHGLICKDPEPYVVFEDFGESNLIFHLYFWLDLAGSANGGIVASDLRLIIEKRFEEQGIGVPFPQRDLHLSAERPLEIHLAREHKQDAAP